MALVRFVQESSVPRPFYGILGVRFCKIFAKSNIVFAAFSSDILISMIVTVIVYLINEMMW